MTFSGSRALVLLTAMILGNSPLALAQSDASPSTVTRALSLSDLGDRPGKLELRLGKITIMDFEQKILSVKSGNAAMIETSIEGSRIFIRPRNGSGDNADLVVILADNTVLVFELSIVKGEGSAFRYTIQTASIKSRPASLNTNTPMPSVVSSAQSTPPLVVSTPTTNTPVVSAVPAVTLPTVVPSPTVRPRNYRTTLVPKDKTKLPTNSTYKPFTIATARDMQVSAQISYDARQQPVISYTLKNSTSETLRVATRNLRLVDPSNRVYVLFRSDNFRTNNVAPGGVFSGVLTVHGNQSKLANLEFDWKFEGDAKMYSFKQTIVVPGS